MSAPGKPIEFSQVQLNDKILIRNAYNVGTDLELIHTVEGFVADQTKDKELKVNQIRLRGSNTWYSEGDTKNITLLERPPIRQAIKVEELKTVPIGTHIELECQDTWQTLSGKLISRTEANVWTITIEGHCFRYLRSIKPGTVFILEGAKT